MAATETTEFQPRNLGYVIQHVQNAGFVDNLDRLVEANYPKNPDAKAAPKNKCKKPLATGPNTETVSYSKQKNRPRKTVYKVNIG